MHGQKIFNLPIRYFLALLWAHPILHVSGIRVNLLTLEPAIHHYNETEERNPHRNILLHYMHLNITLLHKITVLEIHCFSIVQLIIPSTCYLSTGKLFALFTLSLHDSISRYNRITDSKILLPLVSKSQVIIQTDIYIYIYIYLYLYFYYL